MGEMYLRTGHYKRWGKGQYLLRCPTLKLRQRPAFHNPDPPTRSAGRMQSQGGLTNAWTGRLGMVVEKRHAEMSQLGFPRRHTRTEDQKR